MRKSIIVPYSFSRTEIGGTDKNKVYYIKLFNKKFEYSLQISQNHLSRITSAASFCFDFLYRIEARRGDYLVAVANGVPKFPEWICSFVNF